jgi:hypothetical protein
LPYRKKREVNPMNKLMCVLPEGAWGFSPTNKPIK